MGRKGYEQVPLLLIATKHHSLSAICILFTRGRRNKIIERKDCILRGSRTYSSPLLDFLLGKRFFFSLSLSLSSPIRGILPGYVRNCSRFLEIPPHERGRVKKPQHFNSSAANKVHLGGSSLIGKGGIMGKQGRLQKCVSNFLISCKGGRQTQAEDDDGFNFFLSQR